MTEEKFRGGLPFAVWFCAKGGPLFVALTSASFYVQPFE
jgi:hypothetical protein